MNSDSLYEADVVVAGGGPAGIVAALAARRMGADTLLVERHGFLGGTVTAGFVVDFIGFFTVTEERRLVVRGLPWELLQTLEAVGGARLNERWIYGPFYTVDVEAFKYHVQELLLDEGVRLLLHGVVVGSDVRDGRVESAVVGLREGQRRVRGKVFVDATGNADLAAAAGAPFVSGGAGGRMQAVSMGLMMGGVDVERATAVAADDVRAAMALHEQESGWEFPVDWVKFKSCLFPGTVVTTSTRVATIDGTRSSDMTRAEVEARRQAHETARFLREKVPGFERAFLVATSVEMGVRETRHVTGHYVLSADDLRVNRRFADVIGLGAWQMEMHLPGTKHITRESIPEPGDYDIPYRCLVPLETRNLLVAGRCVSATQEAAASLRVMATCGAMGHAAGVAAALCAQGNISPADLPVQRLQKVLMQQGAELGDYWNLRGVTPP